MPTTLELCQNLAAALVDRLRELHRERPGDERVQRCGHTADDVVRMLGTIAAEPMVLSLPLVVMEMT